MRNKGWLAIALVAGARVPPRKEAAKRKVSIIGTKSQTQNENRINYGHSRFQKLYSSRVTCSPSTSPIDQGGPPANTPSGKPPLYPENGGFLHGVCSPYVFPDSSRPIMERTVKFSPSSSDRGRKNASRADVHAIRRRSKEAGEQAFRQLDPPGGHRRGGS